MPFPPCQPSPATCSRLTQLLRAVPLPSAEDQVLELVSEKITIFSRNNKVIAEVLLARTPRSGMVLYLQLLKAYALLLYGLCRALLRVAFVEWPLRLAAVPMRLFESVTGRNSGWVGH